MKNLFVFMAVGMIGTSILAAPTKFSCSNVGGTEEWTIYIDIKKKLAGFFDNDSTVTIPLKDITFLKSLPPQTLYTFEGKDTGGASNSKLRISFNKTKMSASITLNLGKPSEKTLRSLDGCEVNDNVDL